MFYSTNMKLIGIYELTAPGRRCPLWEETANETIIVLTHRTEPKDERREATTAARKFCASFGLLNVNVVIGEMRGLKLKRSSTVGDREPSLVGRIWNPKSSRFSTVGDGEPILVT